VCGFNLLVVATRRIPACSFFVVEVMPDICCFRPILARATTSHSAMQALFHDRPSPKHIGCGALPALASDKKRVRQRRREARPYGRAMPIAVAAQSAAIWAFHRGHSSQQTATILEQELQNRARSEDRDQEAGKGRQGAPTRRLHLPIRCGRVIFTCDHSQQARLSMGESLCSLRRWVHIAQSSRPQCSPCYRTLELGCSPQFGRLALGAVSLPSGCCCRPCQ
jgi:hypothetical protein